MIVLTMNEPTLINPYVIYELSRLLNDILLTLVFSLFLHIDWWFQLENKSKMEQKQHSTNEKDGNGEKEGMFNNKKRPMVFTVAKQEFCILSHFQLTLLEWNFRPKNRENQTLFKYSIPQRNTIATRWAYYCTPHWLWSSNNTFCRLLRSNRLHHIPLMYLCMFVCRCVCELVLWNSKAISKWKHILHFKFETEGLVIVRWNQIVQRRRKIINKFVNENHGNCIEETLCWRPDQWMNSDCWLINCLNSESLEPILNFVLCTRRRFKNTIVVASTCVILLHLCCFWCYCLSQYDNLARQFCECWNTSEVYFNDENPNEITEIKSHE